MAAQGWHALTGYVIFRVATEFLGDAGYGAFTTVLWTMTTLEVLVTEGVPRALALRIARGSNGTAAALRRGLLTTCGLAALLCVALFVAAPFLAAAWRAPELAEAVRISGLDFLTFAGFAVFAALANGLHNFAAQARAQFAYSTLKVVVVSLMLWQTRSVAGAMAGYVLASLGGSLAAWWLTRGLHRGTEHDDAATPAVSAWPFALQSLLLLLLLNVDLWVGATLAGAQNARFGLYGMAATLCRSVYFVLRAVGEALLPTVARAMAQRDALAAGELLDSTGQQDAVALSKAATAVSDIVKRGIALLLVLLLPITSVGIACGGTVLALLFGEGHHADGEAFLVFLLPAAAAFTVLAVQVALLNAAQRAREALLLLAAALVTESVACSIAASGGTLQSVALAACCSAVAAALVGAWLLRRAFGPALPLGAVLYSVFAAVAVYALARAWHPADWWVFVWGALLCALSVGGALLCGVLPWRRLGPAAPPRG